MTLKTVGILIFDDVEVLDFCGPLEVFATVRPLGQHLLDVSARQFDVITIAESEAMIKCRAGLMVQPHYTIDNHPPLDILVVPGGIGVRRELQNAKLLDWIAAQNQTSSLTMSVCTGSFLLAARGLLDGQVATTHQDGIKQFREAHPSVTVREKARYVDSGHIVTSAGVSAGIDMALYVVCRLLGEEVAAQAAHVMEYEWSERHATLGAVQRASEKWTPVATTS